MKSLLTRRALVKHYTTVMAEISRKVGLARKASVKTVEYDLTPLYDEIVTSDCQTAKATRKHERQVEGFDRIVEMVMHDLQELGFEVSEDDCCLTIKRKP